jgi:hypothetical protein
MIKMVTKQKVPETRYLSSTRGEVGDYKVAYNSFISIEIKLFFSIFWICLFRKGESILDDIDDIIRFATDVDSGIFYIWDKREQKAYTISLFIRDKPIKELSNKFYKIMSKMVNKEIKSRKYIYAMIN